jgi:hypothetical protein
MALDEGVLDEIRDGCRDVCEQARFVRIDRERLVALTGELDPLASPPAGPPDPWAVTAERASTDPAEAAEANDATAALVLALASVNFGSGYHDHVRKRPGCSGAVTMATALREWAVEPSAGGRVTVDRLLAVTPADAHRIFGQGTDDPLVRELMAAFAQALRDLGRLVGDRGGRFTDVVREAGGSAAGLVEILRAMPFFRDELPYGATVVPFYKRAQLAAADLARAFGGTDVGAFDDLDQLTAFADNLVPHVLRVEGVLAYDPTLAATIDAGVPIERGDPAEVEIRAAGVHGVELLKGAWRERGVAVTAAQLDSLLWNRGAAPRFKAVPRHRTRSVFY